MYLDEKFGRTAIIKGKEYLFFSGYDYLSIQSHPAFNKLIVEGIKKYGLLYPSARISNTHIYLYQECEAKLSELTQTEETVLFASGFNAGQSIISLYKDKIKNAPLSHPSISNNPSTFDEFENWKNDIVTNFPKNELVVAADAINNFNATIYNFDSLANLSNATIIIDDSHGIGITGINGRGISSYIKRNNENEYSFTYSLSKAFGIQSGAVSTTHKIAQQLRQLPAFTAVTPPSPAQLYAFVKASNIYIEQLYKLKENIQYIRNLLSEIPTIKMHEELPIIILPTYMREKDFLDNGFIISSFSYPNSNSPKLNRLIINASHTKKDLEKVAKFMSKIISN